MERSLCAPTKAKQSMNAVSPQQPQHQDPFEILGLEPSFRLEPKLLEKRHRDLSRALHPDRYAGRPALERRRALNQAIGVNEAFRVLRDPVRRASALLERYGVETSEQAPNSTAMPPEFLMEMMQLREELSAARQQRRVAAIEGLAKQTRERQQQVVETIATEFDEISGSLPVANSQRLERLRGQIATLRFLRRLMEEIEVSYDELL